MGTSAFDILDRQNNQSASNPVKAAPLDNSTGAVSTPKSAFDILDENPMAASGATQFSNQLGNSAKFIGASLAKIAATPYTITSDTNIAPKIGKYLGNVNSAIDSVGEKAASTILAIDKGSDDFGNYIAKTSLRQIPGDALSKIRKSFADALPDSAHGLIEGMGSGLVQQFVEDPLSALTQQKNDNGVPMPMSADELSKKYLSVAGTIAMGETAKMIHGALLPTTLDNSAQAIALNQVSKVGKLAKVVGTDVAAGAVSGGIQGAISNLGDPNEIAKSLAGALTFAPLGAAMGLFGVKPYERKLQLERARLTGLDNAESFQQLAALNSLRVNDNTSLADIAHSIDGINTSDNILEAAIKSKLSVGKGFVIEGVAPVTELPQFPNAHVYHSPVTNTLAVSPFSLNPTAERFFKRSGFIQYEGVTHNGVEHYISDHTPKGIEITDINSGKTQIVKPSDIIRTNTSPITSFVTANDGTAVDNQGVISSSSVLKNYTDSFVKLFKSKESNGIPFDDLVAKFATDKGIANKDLPLLHQGIYKAVSDDLANTHLTPRERILRKQVQGVLVDSNLGYRNAMDDMTNTSDANGMYVKVEGGGRYSIKTISDNTLIGHATNPEEAIKLITRSGQVNGIPLDGAGSNAIPTNAASNGAYNQTFNPQYSSLAQKIDIIRTSGIGQYIVPAVRWWESVDNLNQGRTTFLKPLLKLQELQNNLRNFANTTGKPVIDQYNTLQNMFKSVKADRMHLISDNAEAFSIDDIKNRYLDRPMLPGELATAEAFKGVNTNDVLGLIKSVRENTGKKLGSLDFNTALTELKGGTAPDVWNAVMSLNQGIATSHPEVYSPLAVLKLAKALEDPGTALSRVQHAVTNGLTPLESTLADKLQTFHQEALQRGAVDPTVKINGSLPDIQIHQALGFDGSNIKPSFGETLAKAAIVPEGVERNPVIQANRYIYSFLQSASGFADGITNVQKEFNDNIKALKSDVDINGNPTSRSKVANNLETKFKEYLDDVRGIPNNNDQIGKLFASIGKQMGVTINPNSVFGLFRPVAMTNLFSMAQLALRPALAARDLHNAYLQAGTRFGWDFANRAFMGGLETKQMDLLQDRGAIPHTDNAAISNPQGIKDLVNRESAIGKGASLGFKYSGQEGVYNRSLAGIWIATNEDVMKNLKDLKSNVIDKETAYKNLKLSAQSPTVQRVFDDLVQAGKPTEAADFLGRYRGRELSNIFGNNNNPAGWKSTFGRVMGQYGSYSANAMNTYLDNISRGSYSDIAGRVMRGGIGYGVTAAAGAATGLNLNSWQIAQPWHNIVNPGPLTEMAGDISKTIDQQGLAAGVAKLGSDFIPYSRALKGWKEAYEKGNPLAAFGFKIDK